MLRYRMTPPARGRPPVATKRGARQLAQERAEATGRGAHSWAARPVAAAEVESLPNADCQLPIEAAIDSQARVKWRHELNRQSTIPTRRDWQ